MRFILSLFISWPKINQFKSRGPDFGKLLCSKNVGVKHLLIYHLRSARIDSILVAQNIKGNKLCIENKHL